MFIKLPTIKKTPVYNDSGEINEVKKEIVEVQFNLDTSAYADLRFEQFFRRELPDKSLADFVIRMTKVQSHDAMANYLSLLKVLYCYLESDYAPTFVDFIKLFDLSIVDLLIPKIHQIVKLALSSATKN